MTGKSRPPGGSQTLAESDPTIQPPADRDLQPPELTPLARLLIGRVTDRHVIPIQRFGSPEWDALPDQDPRQAASVCIAAEAWRRWCSPWQVAEDMRRELAEQSDAIARLFVETGHEVNAAADWPAIFSRATYAELCDRRGEHERAERARERWAS